MGLIKSGNLINAVSNKLGLSSNLEITAGFYENKIAEIAEINNYGGIIPLTPELKAKMYRKAGIVLKNDPELKKQAMKMIKDLSVTEIPSRPFVSDIAKNKMQYLKMFKNSVIQTKNFIKSANSLAKKLEKDMIKNASSGEYQDNNILTVMLKGFNHPLLETGKMQKSIHSKVVEK